MFVTAIAALIALFGQVGVAPLCALADGPEPCCCKPDDRCAVALQKADCCQLGTSPASSDPPVLQSASPVRDKRDLDLAGSAAKPGGSDAPQAGFARAVRTEETPPPGVPLELFILNASLRR